VQPPVKEMLFAFPYLNHNEIIIRLFEKIANNFAIPNELPK